VGRYIKKGGHGGLCRGAGRRAPSKLDRLLIGARVEELAHVFEHLPDQRLDYDDIRQSQNALQQIPVKERKQLSGEAREHLDWLKEALKRRRVGRGGRPKLTDLVSSLAEEATELLGVSISARQIRRWRDQYLATKK
jgi:hypothetical protein